MMSAMVSWAISAMLIGTGARRVILCSVAVSNADNDDHEPCYYLGPRAPHGFSLYQGCRYDCPCGEWYIGPAYFIICQYGIVSNCRNCGGNHKPTPPVDSLPE